MSTRESIVAAALAVLEDGGPRQFSTRAVCDIAGVTAPTLYHHFGSADGLLSAAITEAFEQFLRSKRAAVQASDPVAALCEGWDDYVRFAAARPRLYAAMLGRILDGARIPAAEQGNLALRSAVEAVASAGRLAVSLHDAIDIVWASAGAAALLYVTASLRGFPAPSDSTIRTIRDAALVRLLVA